MTRSGPSSGPLRCQPMPSPQAALLGTHSGLRGRPGAELSGEAIESTVAGLIELLRQRGLPSSLGLARDERPTSESIAADVCRTALDHGVDVLDFGVLTAPGAKLAARSHGLGGAVIVTGSHLDPGLNGLKLVAGPRYGPVDVRQLPKPTEGYASRRGRRWRDEGAAAAHVAAIAASVDVERVRAARLSVDCGGGAGSAASLLLTELGCAPPGEGPDLGLRLDADGDRLQLVDDRGELLDTELTLPMVLIARDARTVIKGADTSRMVDALAEARGGSVRTVPPGEIHLVTALAAGADLAGEGNGGVIVPEVGLARDGLAAAASILWLLARLEGTLTSALADLPRYERRRSTIPYTEPSKGRASLEALARRMGVELADPEIGVAVERGAGTWGLARMSATEPVLRVTVESSNHADAESLHAELRAPLLEGPQSR